MIHFVQIDPAGRILRSGSAPCRDLREMPGVDDSFRRVPHAVQDPNAFFWDDGLVALPAAPSPFHRFDVATRRWVMDKSRAWAAVRAERDVRLQACDWRVLPDSPTPGGMRQAWLDYRQALRDVTGQGDPRAIVWPAAPV